jgi:hypothetical protein
MGDGRGAHAGGIKWVFAKAQDLVLVVSNTQLSTFNISRFRLGQEWINDMDGDPKGSLNRSHAPGRRAIKTTLKARGPLQALELPFQNSILAFVKGTKAMVSKDRQ